MVAQAQSPDLVFRKVERESATKRAAVMMAVVAYFEDKLLI
jgi:hypothetical protein